MGDNLSMIILAGGKSSRMGTDKADLTFNGKTFLRIQIEKGLDLGIKDIIISGYNGSFPYQMLSDNIRNIPDNIIERGPLGGLEATLRAAYNPICLVVCVDMPLIPTHVLKDMISFSDKRPEPAIILNGGGRDQPLCAIYRSSLVPCIQEAIKAGKGAVFSFLRQATYAIYQAPESDIWYQNINDSDSYRKFCESGDNNGN